MDTLLRQLKRCITISDPSSSPFHWQSEQMTIKKIIKDCSPLVRNEAILGCAPKKIVLSGPSGFLGAHVLDSILDVHEARMAKGLDPGEVILMSSSPGNMMKRLQRKYGEGKMKTIRASRVDYFTQHEVDTWRDQLGSLGLKGEKATFINLAALAGPVGGKLESMMDVNYKAPVAAAKACQQLGFGHWVQSSTQATNSERAGQVPYARAKAMTDFALANIDGLPVSVACLGLLYQKSDGMIGQQRGGKASLNLIDLSLLPLTPIMGDGSAPLQPQEVTDASNRIAYLALTDPANRPHQTLKAHDPEKLVEKCPTSSIVRFYDAVGPETVTMVNLLERFSHYQGRKTFRPVYIDYRNMERVLNVKSLGNLNRQFVSLLRSEQGSKCPILGNPAVWNSLLGPGNEMTTLDRAFQTADGKMLNESMVRGFPYLTTLQWVLNNPGVIPPGIKLSFEILSSLFFGPRPCK